MINKFQKTISWITLVCVALFTTVVFVQMWHNLFKNYFPFNPGRYAGLLIVGLILVLVVGFILYKLKDDNRVTNRVILLVLLAIFAVVGIMWINFVPNTQLSDFGGFWSHAKDVLDGKKIYHFDNDYFAKWAYQTGYLAYVVGATKIFGYHIAAIQYLNVLYQVLILWVVYELVVKIFDNIKMARLSVLLLMINLDWFALNSQADNQYLGSLLFLTTFYLILQDKYWTYILAGLTLALGSIIRPIGPVIIAGIVVFALVYMFMRNNKFQLSGIYKLLVVLAVYFVIFSGAGMLIKSSGLNEYGLSNRDTEWKFVIGLDENSKGVYDTALVNSFDMNQSRAKVLKQEKEVVHEHVEQLNKTHGWFNLFQAKLATLWSKRATGIDFTGIEVNHSPVTVNVVQFVGYVGSILTIIFSWIGSLKLFKFNYKNGLFLLLLPLMAFVIVQLLIEVQGRYRIEFIPVLAVLGGTGLYTIFDWIKTSWSGRHGRSI
ncbi:hypothetical protein [Companilactobacillus ginsenosidimutans]|uniref:Glycosyltransferase RgtA/B/C/D-like domain-containing protein n=1 Tax=Companilactobacillus ginsenosidimutans TaxID=1007676 RepID=A0A0H4QI20_9LACO|nr:hypothetical protein [Companilactobacillus ginsenosidimutans]AKP68074.1 hypothetical protein ABM34_11370 [Companilactobacillus ginsenosidimutans]